MYDGIRTMLLHVGSHSVFATDIQFAVGWEEQFISVFEVVSQAAAQKTAAASDEYFVFHNHSYVAKCVAVDAVPDS